MAFSLQTHVRQGDKIVRVQPYVRISRSGGPTLYLQNGHIYTEGGGRADPIPSWFPEELKKINSKALSQVGFHSTERRPGRPKGSGKKAKKAAEKVKKVSAPAPTEPVSELTTDGNATA